MDTSTTYREIVKQMIIQYSKLRPSHGDIRLDPIFDETHDRYALMQVGWDRGRRVRGNLIYVTLQNGKVYIEYDGIEHGITQDLIVMGVSPLDIVLAFLPESELAASAGKL
ncbi:MAG: XisI protein [Nostoc sp.]|uniref:XisI protein n=1 Tax=Nostoc sp. TaxID=1180 RepID=UPI002FF7707E